ncbi:ABC transporter ATP-binding protein [Tianweitania sediminis]|uniref:ABC transporter ATP-binding protein n=1 Tax=Tianweitania sediminis TaxID=1502156 RepID=A0A8J7UIN4_9HYPH|nr:ABC transporter ATP-binding protein [Tianweitania sediminis]MBP0439098.1 ABC transporter ATP-binding protein [Tianweitania sediminis]
MNIHSNTAMGSSIKLARIPEDQREQSPALEMQGVAKDYGSLRVLNPIDMTVGSSEFLTLLGPSGSGKSTILSIAAGISEPSEGKVISRGRDVTFAPPHARNIGMVFQRYTLFPNKSVFDNVAFPLKVRGLPEVQKRGRVMHFLQLVGLEQLAKRFPSEISGGQAQRVALARALVFEPDLLLMDEPLGALDRRLRQNLQDEIRRIQIETRIPTLYVTHDQEEAMSMSDRIIILRAGDIVENDKPAAIYRSPRTLWSAQFLGDANAVDVLEMFERGGETWVHVEGGLEIRARMPEHASDRSKLIVRPEDCVVVEDGQEPTGCTAPYIRGVVEGITFLGPFQHVHVKLDCGWKIRTIVSGDSILSQGAIVNCGFKANKPIVVPTT